MNKIEKILADIEKYQTKGIKENVTERLDKILKRYLEDLDHSYSLALQTDKDELLRRLKKWK